MTRTHTPTPIAQAVAASLGAAAAHDAVPATQIDPKVLSPEDMAFQTAQAIAKIDQLNQYLRSGELHAKIAAEVVQLMNANGTLETAVETVINKQLPLITQELRQALSLAAPEVVVQDEPVPPVKRTAEEIQRENVFVLVAEGNTMDPDSMLVFQVKLPSSMNPADSVVEFFSIEEDGHLKQVGMADGYPQLALKLFQSDPSKFFFGTQYLVQLMTINEANVVVEDTDANEPSTDAPPPAPQIC